LLLDVDYAGLELGVEAFITHIRPGDVVLIYYAGHGMQIAQENYILPVDFAPTTALDARRAGYSASTLLDRVHSQQPRLTIMMLDACSDNPFAMERSLVRGWAPMQTGNGTFIALASSPGEPAEDNPAGSNGLFTAHLLRALSVPFLTLDDLFRRVREGVLEASGRRQRPWISSSVVGDFVFTRLAAGPPAGTEAADRLTRSLTLASRAIEANPKDPSAYYVRGIHRARIGDLASATADLDRAIALSPKYTVALLERARLRLLLKDLRGAVEDTSSVIALSGPEPGVVYMRAVARMLAREYLDVLEDTTAVIRAAPTAVSAYALRAAAYSALARFRDAVEDCDRAIVLDPGYAAAHVVRGQSLLSIGRSKDAEEEFRRAAELTHRRATAW
jgi:tetratricopeptide (TPR) repeat protein